MHHKTKSLETVSAVTDSPSVTRGIMEVHGKGDKMKDTVTTLKNLCSIPGGRCLVPFTTSYLFP